LFTIRSKYLKEADLYRLSKVNTLSSSLVQDNDAHFTKSELAVSKLPKLKATSRDATQPQRVVRPVPHHITISMIV
jgi:hypothetical protein